MTDSDQLVVWLRETLDAAERAAKATTPVPVPGEWAAVRDKHAADDAPLTIIQGQNEDDPDYENYSSNVPVIAHAAEWQDEAEANLRFIALNDPAAVLRRIAADRKTLARHQPKEMVYGIGPVGRILACSYDPHPWPCPDITDLAEGWGWTEETTDVDAPA